MAVFTDIQKALEILVNSISGKPSKIVWDNTKPYTPVIGTKFWRVQNFPADSTYITADGLTANPGILQIDVFTPRDKAASSMFNDLDKLEEKFRATSKVTQGNSKITFRAPSRANMQHEPAWFHGAIKIEYICYN